MGLAHRLDSGNGLDLILDDTIDLLPLSKPHKIAKKCVEQKHRSVEADPPTNPGLLADVKAFEKASLAGEFYRSFSVNSRNSMEKSSGTLAWITKFLRLLAECADKAKKGDPKEVRECMDILFSLLDFIDRGYPEIVFFADEAGSWQVGVDWAKILPVWFTVLSATAEPDEYSQRVVAMVSRHYNYGRAEMLRIARRVATPSQRQALASIKGK